jgi:hypothetical protein
MASSDADPMDAIPPSEVPEMSDAGDLRGEDDQAPEGQHVAANSLMQMPTTPAYPYIAGPKASQASVALPQVQGLR